MVTHMLETTLQKNIKDRLEKKNISIAELERRAGLRHAVINILHGRSKNPSIRVAQAIAKELGCSVEDLLSEKKEAYIKSNDDIATVRQNPDKNINTSTISCEQSQPWNPFLARKALDVVNQYLLENGLNPETTEIFQCIDEIYKYAYNSPHKNIDHAFVSWIAERFFIRHLK